MNAQPGIGTLAESPLHRDLKQHYTQPGDLNEVLVGSHVVDVLRPGLAIEIQTGSFARLAGKLDMLLRRIDVRLVYPACVRRHLVKVDDHGCELSRRKSPKRGGFDEVFLHLVSLTRVLAHPRFSLEVVATVQEELRLNAARGRRWRRDWSLIEKRLVDVHDARRVGGPLDLYRLLDVEVPARFTTRELALLLGRPLWHAQKIAYCLRETGAARVVDKHGNAIVYQRADRD